MKDFTVAVVFAKEDESDFKRCTFPILGRPVFAYPLLAALNSESVDFTYVSTSSERIVSELKGFENVRCIKRRDECGSLLEEIKRTTGNIIDELGEHIDKFVILLGNSPCVLNSTIDNAIEILDEKKEIDSVATAEKRHFHNPATAFKMTEKGLLKPSLLKNYSDYCY